jgi:uncharacterized membrane protein HdeD (DUF308 family)
MTAGPPATPAAEAALAKAQKRWWIPFVAGILSVIVGFVALVFPEPTLLAIGILFGAFFLIWGVMLLISGIADSDASTLRRVLEVILGLFAAVAGVILLFRPDESVLTAAFTLGFYFILSGILQFVSGVAAQEHRVSNIIWGIIGIIAGVIILASPRIGIITLVLVVGFSLIFQGFVQIAIGWSLRRLHKAHEEPGPGPGAAVPA